MASIQEKIQDAANRNAELLAGLHETESAPAQLYQQISYLKDLDEQIKKSERQLAAYKKRTAAELEDHRKYSESTFRRFAHKASGRKDRFEEKAAKEEREYFDAIQAQKTAEDDLAYVRQLKAEAEITKQEYEKTALQHDEFQRELDALYNSIFAGYTPGFPDEDAQEHSVNAASEHSADVNQRFQKEKQMLHLLKQILGKLGEAKRHLAEAHSASTMDMLGGGTFSSMQKRNYLEKAESSISQVRMLQDQVKNVEPNFRELGSMRIASASIWGDVIFDNVFTDLDMHDKIKDSERQIQGALMTCNQRIKESETREKEVQEELKRASEMLKQARISLQKARERAFESVARGERIDENATVPEVPSEAPPAYSA